MPHVATFTHGGNNYWHSVKQAPALRKLKGQLAQNVSSVGTGPGALKSLPRFTAMAIDGQP